MQLITYFSGFEMSTRLSVTGAWFSALEIKTGTANKKRNYHKVLAF